MCSAGLYIKGQVNPDRTPTGADFHRMRTYCTTKLANLLMLKPFARRWHDAGVTIDAVHPGVIKTGLGDPGGPLGLLLKFVKRSWAEPAQGAAPIVKLAFEPGSGRYFDQDREVPLAPGRRRSRAGPTVVGPGEGAHQCHLSSSAARRPRTAC